MASTSITTGGAYQICYWVDQGASGNPPAPWTTVFYPKRIFDPQNPNFAVILQDSTNPQQYAVVVQGTKNAGDAVLDFDIDTVVNFSPIAGVQIAQGASSGLSNVLKLKDAKGQSLQHVLSSIDWKKNFLFLGGHSLGGTIASLLAPWAAVNLFGQQQPIAQLPSALQVITFAPFAAGNQAFANFLNSQSNYQANFNTNDAVPHVWATSGQYSVPNMYALFPSPGPSPIPSNLQAQIQKKVNGIPPGFSYVQTGGISFTYPSAKPPAGGPDQQWLWELSYQHNNAYDSQFGASSSSSK